MKTIEKNTAKSRFYLAYNTLPSWYDIRGFFNFHLAYQTNLLRQIKFFGANLKNPHLEVAIGSGTFFKMQLWWRKWRGYPSVELIHGMDCSPAMIAGAHHRLKNIKLDVMNVEDLQFPDNYFASINIANAAHCFADVEKSMLEIIRVLQPSGVLALNILLVPRGGMSPIARWVNHYGMDKGILYRPYHYDEVMNLMVRLNFIINYEKISGNTLNLVVTKKP